MVGFIKNIFGSKNDNNGEQQPRQKQQAFYLDPDEAKTYGDIDYMRQPTKTRKSFPKSVGNPEGGEIIEEVSALEKKSLSKKQSKKKSNQSSSTSVTPSESTQEGKIYSAKDDPEIQKRRQSDSSMDMFRNMAKDIKK